MPSLGSLLLLALIFVTVGFIGGALVSLLWLERDQEDASPVEPEEKSFSPVKGADEIVSIWREPASEKLIFKIGKDQYQNASQLGDQKRQALEKVALRWISWLRASADQLTEPLPRNEYAFKTETESRLVQVTAPAQQAEDEKKMELPGNPKIRVENQPAPLPPQKVVVQPVPPTILPKAQILNKEVEKIQPKSIVAQIDDILQEMILKMQDAPRGVRLTEDPKGGVIVWAGTKSFSGIDMVEDASIQNLIRSAVAEWEKRAVH